MNTARRGPLEAEVTGVVYVSTHPDRMAVSVRSLLFRTPMTVHVGILYPLYSSAFRELQSEFGERLVVRPVGSVSELCNVVYGEARTHLFVVNDVVLLPPGPLDNALRWMNDDLRIATVSFLSNAADFLSFPVRNLPVGRPVDGHDEISITERLRSRSPLAVPAPVVYAAGSAVVISAAVLGAVGDLVAPASARFDVSVADFSVRAREKGFIDVVDTGTFVTRPSDVAVAPIDEKLTYDDRGWLLHRHRSMVAFLDAERVSGDSAFALAHQVARVKVNGLRVLIDGSCFGPVEVGTQVATLHTIRALAQHDDVAEVCVSVPGAVPGHAAEVLTMPKVRALNMSSSELESAVPIDIAYRPYQPTPGWDVQLWKRLGVRLVVSVLDTIAFHNGGYFASTGEWMAYRSHLLDSVRAADAVTVISDDVIGQMRLHRFPIDDARVVSVPLGTEHLSGDQPTELPRALASRGFGVGPFALCLGVNYTHKNREMALAAHELVREAGFDLTLVMAGAAVPNGTTRVSEARLGTREHVFVIPEVSGPERNWLLRHASFVWYPTSAEGFGLVPFEAAAFGTPTVAVEFGPIAELARSVDPQGRSFGADVPLLAPDWDPAALARIATAFLRDPDLSRRHAQALALAGGNYRWDRTAATLVELFRRTLGQPRR
jgi:glycosyltransferase involved in cell wall biosynthesis